ncbi:hypothetical protein GCM10027185_48990 [Spirosoma pulveris]
MMNTGIHITQNNPAHHGGSTFVTVQAQFGQQLSVTVLSWTSGYPDRVRTQWGAVLRRNTEGIYDPE